MRAASGSLMLLRAQIKAVRAELAAEVTALSGGSGNGVAALAQVQRAAKNSNSSLRVLLTAQDDDGAMLTDEQVCCGLALVSSADLTCVTPCPCLT